MAFRDGPFENIKVPALWTAAVAVVVLVVVSIMMLIGDQRMRGLSSDNAQGRAAADATTGPVNDVLAAPVRGGGGLFGYIGGYFFAVSENRRLRQELAEANDWKDQAIALKSLNARYEGLLGITPEPAVPMQTARTVRDVRGPFSNARLLNAGSSKGIRVGNPVMGEHGLVGRISGVSPGYSRMLLLTDVASRTPVLIERSDARAILTGDGSDNPRLEYVRGAGSVQEGDRVLSSGDGGGAPRGLPVGVVARGLDGKWRVKLYSDRGPMDYVRVLLFRDFNQLIDPSSLSTPPLTGLASAPQPTPEQTAAILDAAARREAARVAEAERLAAQRADEAVRAQAAAQAAAQARAAQARPAASAAPPAPGGG